MPITLPPEAPSGAGLADWPLLCYRKTSEIGPEFSLNARLG
jgi:hypothetical protein